MSFPASFDLTTLDGSNGFVINGVKSEYSGVGYSLAVAGDINGDGFDDLIIGVQFAGNLNGRAYVVFGTNSGFLPSLDVSSLDGSNGFVIKGADPQDFLGTSVAGVGDVNGDGIDDLMVGAEGTFQNGAPGGGSSYIIFGSQEEFSASLQVSDLNQNDGFVLNGGGSFKFTGESVSGAGDINGDGVDDLLIGGETQAFVRFGKTDGFQESESLSSLNGTNGFVLSGDNTETLRMVAGVGDFNGDGFDDILVGGKPIDSYSVQDGSAYVIFGKKSGFSADMKLLNVAALNGNNGFSINTTNLKDDFASSVAGIGDINGDGLEDLAITALLANAKGNTEAGQVYIVFGSTTLDVASLDVSTLDGVVGFTIDGSEPSQKIGSFVAGAGDVNKDGIDDLIVGAKAANGRAGAGYIVFGSSTGFDAHLDIGTLDGSNGFAIPGIVANSRTGYSVAGDGDINGDGIDDFLISSPYARNPAGRTYVVFGVNPDAPVARSDSGAGFETVYDFAFTTGSVLENDSDPNGEPLAVSGLVTTRTKGLVADNGDGTFAYDPNGQFAYLAAGETATDIFSYEVSDIGGDSASATVSITVAGPSEVTNSGDAFRFIQGTNGGADWFGFNGDAFFIAPWFRWFGKQQFDDFDDFLQAAVEVFDGRLVESGEIDDQALPEGGGPDVMTVDANGLVTLGGAGTDGLYQIAFDNEREGEVFVDFVGRVLAEIDANDAVATDPTDFRFDAGGLRVFFDDVNDQFGFTDDGGTTQTRVETLEEMVEALAASFGGTQLRDGDFDGAAVASHADPWVWVTRWDDVAIAGRGVDGYFRFDFNSRTDARAAADAFETLFDLIDDANTIASGDSFFF